MSDDPRPTATQPRDHPLSRYVLPALLALALAVRGGALLLMPDALAGDPDDYRGLAENLIEHGSLETPRTPSAYRPPLYPLMLAPCVALGPCSRAAIGMVHLAMGLATVWLVFILGGHWGLGQYRAALAAALVACDPILLAWSTQVMTETPATLLAVLALLGLTSAGQRPTARRAALAGGCLSLAALCRPAMLFWAATAAVVLPISVHGPGTGSSFGPLRAERCACPLPARWPTRLKVLAAVTIAMAAVLSPWALRNYLRLGRPVVTTTHGGYTLLLGNNPEFYQYLRTGAWGSVWQAEQLSETWRNRAAADELGANRQAYAEAWQNIRRQPRMFLYSCLVRVGRLWNPLPHQLTADEGLLRRAGRYAVGLWYLAELPLAVLGLWTVLRSRWRRGWLWGLLLVGSLTAVHTLYWTDMRMRASLMPVVALAAAAGWARHPTKPRPAVASAGRPGRSP